MIYFGNPGMLWGLSLLAIPIVIHLFNLRRYKTVYFSDISFLQEVQKSTKKQRNIKELLVLIARLLALLFAVLAFAKPYMPVGDANKSAERIIIAIDNSASTTVGNTPLTPFVRAKQQALKVLDAQPPTAQIALYTTGAANGTAFKPASLIRKDIENLQPTDGTFNWSGLLRNARGTSIYAFTDAQQNNLPLQRMANDSAQWVLLPTISEDEARIKNVAVDSVWLNAPFLMAGQSATLGIQLKNYGDEAVSRNVEILTNGLPEITLNISVATDSDTSFTVALTQLKPKFNQVEIRIADDNASFDNALLLSYYVPAANRVVALYDEALNPKVAAIFAGEEFVFNPMTIQQLDRSILLQADLIILQELRTVSSGLENILIEAANNANLLIIPAEKNAQALNALCVKLGLETFGDVDTSKLSSRAVNIDDPFFQNVFRGALTDVYWPTVNAHFPTRGTTALPTFRLLALANGDPLFTRFSANQQNYFMLTTPLGEAYSDLANHPVIVPILLKSLLKRNAINGYTGVVGHTQRFDFLIKDEQSDAAARLQKGTYVQIPRQERIDNRLSISTGTEFTEKGYYHISRSTDTIGVIALNVPKRESDLQRFTPEALREAVTNSGADNINVLSADVKSVETVIRQWQQGIQLWRYVLAISLLLILVEVILLRFLK